MNHKEIAKTRLINQQIVSSKFETAGELAGWMGANQAQDFSMSKWAIGLRLKEPSEEKIHEAIDEAQIIRTHVLRPTWHFVSADDIYWMLNLSAPKLKAGMKGRHRQLELTEKLLQKCNTIIEKSLSHSGNLTRKELVAELNKAKIATDNNRSSHIFLNAELEGIIASGKMKGNQPTFALLEERVQQKKLFNKEESLYKVATKYFQSHSPATLQDFLWWSGLSVSEAKNAISMIRKDFILEKINGVEYLLPFLNNYSTKPVNSVFLLPAFDEFLISYKDRSASVLTDHESKAFSKNGIFWPTIVMNGKVEGTWKHEIKKDKVVITTGFFDSKNKFEKDLLEKEAQKFGNFVNRKAEIIY